MLPLNIMALFCEDIREEKGDVVSLMGVMPDTVNLVQGVEVKEKDAKGANAILPKLCMYIRINFDADFDLPEPRMRLAMPDGQNVEVGAIQADVVSKARQQAKEKGNPLAGVISRVVIAPFRPPEGVMKLEVLISDVAHLAGSLNFKMHREQSALLASNGD